MLRTLEMFKQTQQDKDSDTRYKAQRAEIDKAFATIDEQWLSGKIVLNDLIWVLADGKQKDRDAYILPIIQSAIISKVLTIWNESSSVKLNDRAIHTKELPHKAFVLKQDFLNWLQQEQSVQLPQRLIDLAEAKTKEKKPHVPQLQLEALSKLLKEIEQRAISKKIPFNRDEMFGIREQLHELAIIRFGNQLFAKSQHTFFDYLKNGEICKVKRGNRWSPIYSELFPEHPELKERKTSVKTKITQSPN